MRNAPCPCGSGRKAKGCCLPAIDGIRPAADPVALLRTRYTAYGIGAVGYLIDTTDPLGPVWEADRAAWERSLKAYCARLQLVDLTVFEHAVDGDTGRVRYLARLVIGGRPVDLAENARYRRIDGRWCYSDGDVG